MHTYGDTLRILRKERGFTLKTLSEDIVSYSFLSKYENGESDMTLINLNKLLARLNVTLDEFMNFSDGHIPSYSKLLNKIAVAYSKNNKQQLLKYYYKEFNAHKKTNFTYHKLNYIMIAAIIQDIFPDFKIKDEDTSFYVDYVFGCSYWSRYELSLIGNAIKLFNKNTLSLFLDEVKTRLKEEKVDPLNTDDLLYILHNASVSLIRDSRVSEAKYISEFVTPYIRQSDYFKRTRKLFLDSLISIFEGNRDEGVKNAKKALNIFKQMDETLAQDYKKELDDVLQNTAKEILL